MRRYRPVERSDLEATFEPRRQNRARDGAPVEAPSNASSHDELQPLALKHRYHSSTAAPRGVSDEGKSVESWGGRVIGYPLAVS